MRDENIEHQDVQATQRLPRVPWNGWLGVVYVVVLFFAAQVVASVLVAVYAQAHHWTSAYIQTWLTNSVTAQFAYTVIAEGLTLWGIYVFMRRYKFDFRKLGLRRFRLRDAGYALAAVPVYYVLALVVLLIAGVFAPNINSGGSQQIGFDTAHGVTQLTMTFISLVILPPFTEEVMVRGMLYGSLKKVTSLAVAVISTSVIFAAAHLGEGSAGLLWTAAIQFFVLSLVLIYLREKTQGLWAPILLHAANNAIAFYTLFLHH